MIKVNELKQNLLELAFSLQEFKKVTLKVTEEGLNLKSFLTIKNLDQADINVDKNEITLKSENMLYDFLNLKVDKIELEDKGFKLVAKLNNNIELSLF